MAAVGFRFWDVRRRGRAFNWKVEGSGRFSRCVEADELVKVYEDNGLYSIVGFKYGPWIIGIRVHAFIQAH